MPSQIPGIAISRPADKKIVTKGTDGTYKGFLHFSLWSVALWRICLFRLRFRTRGWAFPHFPHVIVVVSGPTDPRCPKGGRSFARHRFGPPFLRGTWQSSM